MTTMDGGPILLQKSSGTTMSENCSSQTTESGIESVAGQDCPSCLDHLKLIRKQFSRIELLENEISILRCERDALMFENEKLQFEKQVVTEALNSHNRQSRQENVDVQHRFSLNTSSSCNPRVAVLSSSPEDPVKCRNVTNNNNNSSSGGMSGGEKDQDGLVAELVSSNSSFSSTSTSSSTSFATSHESSNSSIGSSIIGTPTVPPGTRDAMVVNGNQGDTTTTGSNVPPTSGPRGSIHSNSSLTSNSSSNSSSVSMDVSSPLVESNHSSDPRSIHRDTSTVIKNQQVINNKHRSSLQMGQQSQSHHSSSSSRHHSSSSQERREEGGGGGRKPHVPHLLQSSNNNSLPLSHSSPSLNVINNGKNQVQLSNSTNNFNVLKAEQFEMIRKRQYRVGLNLFNKSPPERGIQYLIQNNFIDVNGLNPHSRSKQSSTISLNNNNGTCSSSLRKESLVDVDETIESLAIGVAHFLITRKGLSKQSIGDYIGNLQNPFNQRVLHYFVNEIDLIGLPVDVALRKFQTYFRFPGEAQKIDKILEVFSHRFLECNSNLPTRNGLPGVAGDHRSSLNQPRIVQRRSTHQSSSGLPEDWSMINHLDIEDEEEEEDEDDSNGSRSKKRRIMSQNEVHILAFAIIMLNSDLHTPNNKNRMTCDQFIKNYKGAFEAGCDVSDEYLAQIYERIRVNELKTGPDHVSQVMKVQQQLVPGNTKPTSNVPNLSIPSRRLVCFCRLYEVYDVHKKDRIGQHQREVFLFNDLLLVTKIYKKDSSSSSIMSGNNMVPTSTGLTSHSTATNQSPQVTCQYSYRGSYSLSNVSVLLFEAPYYHFGIRIVKRVPGEMKSSHKTLITFNARNEHDRSRFVDDLREAIEEMTLMDSIKLNGFTSDPVLFGAKSSASSLSSTSSGIQSGIRNGSAMVGSGNNQLSKSLNSNTLKGSLMSSSTTSCDLRSSGSSNKSTGSSTKSTGSSNKSTGSLSSSGSNESTRLGTIKPGVKHESIASKVPSDGQNLSKSSSMIDFNPNNQHHHNKSNSSTSTTSSGLGSEK